MPNDPDIVVIGGGPSGSTAATLFAQHGYKVQLFERDHFPRFHIGESLIPDTYFVLERLNMLQKLGKSHFVKKHSVQFVTEKGRLSEPFYFHDHRPHASSQTWQVLRSELDQMLLDNAKEHGVQVFEGARVLEVLFDGNRAVGVRVQDEASRERERPESRVVHAKVVVDASGQSSILLDRMNLREWDPLLRKSALWTYWEGALRDQGRDEGATLVLQVKGKHGWFWYIPQHDNIVSVGVVASAEYLFKDRDGKDHEAIYHEEVSRCPGLVPRLASAKRVAPFRVAKEYSYRTKQAAGDGWVLVGDAYGFLDPLYSSGVLLALKSAQLAADAVAEGLKKNDISAAQLGKWAPDYNRGMARMRRLVVEYYNGFSFGKFVKRYPHFKGHLTDLLMGNLFQEHLDEIWPAMDSMQAEMAEE